MSSVHLRNKKYGTVVRLIRTVKRHSGLAWRVADETYGGYGWLPLDQYTSGEWEIYEEEV